jgi:hypothetical protein
MPSKFKKTYLALFALIIMAFNAKSQQTQMMMRIHLPNNQFADYTIKGIDSITHYIDTIKPAGSLLTN